MCVCVIRGYVAPGIEAMGRKRAVDVMTAAAGSGGFRASM